ncbi:hypothetical protein FA13DRAFT_1797776 [Coprinellus micaceus]|uniref:Uncharacterized protein n=1 Tax=Coprinellus micaceus TaxID=71717 RepID=A0A4Y7SPE0_COPMI|nr:hypothetical protein FA13DRAFT_1797776 [Coprinellus micaceus]
MPASYKCLAEGCSEVYDNNSSLRRHYKKCELYKKAIGQAHELRAVNAASATRELSASSWRNSGLRGPSAWTRPHTPKGSTSRLAPTAATVTAPVATGSEKSTVTGSEVPMPSTSQVLGDGVDPGGLMDIDDVDMLPPMDNEPRPAPPTPLPSAPPPAPPRLHYAEDILPQPLRRVILHIRDKLVTEKNIFGLWREYLHRPHFDPDSFVPPESLAKDAHAHDDLSEPPTPKLNLLSKNKSWGILLSWASTGSQMKSEQEINRLANLLQDVDFNPKELKGLTAQRAAKEMEKEDANSSLLSKFKEAAVSIEVPSGSTAIPSRTVNIPGLYYRPLCSLIRSAFAHP